LAFARMGFWTLNWTLLVEVVATTPEPACGMLHALHSCMLKVRHSGDTEDSRKSLLHEDETTARKRKVAETGVQAALA
jgi:hypothetical protein